MQPLTCGRISTICLPVSRAEYCRSSVMSFFVTTIVRYCCAPCSRFLSSPHDVTSSPPQTTVRTHENNAFFISFVSMLSIVTTNLRKISYFLTIFPSLLKTNNISQANNWSIYLDFSSIPLICATFPLKIFREKFSKIYSNRHSSSETSMYKGCNVVYV